MASELIANAEKMYAALTHPAEAARRRREHQAALLEIRNAYIARCNDENLAYFQRLFKLINEHDVKAMGAKALPTYETVGYVEDIPE